MIKTGLAITAYFCEKTPGGRLPIFEKSIRSLLATGYPGAIYLVDDGSPVNTYLDRLGEIDVDKRITVVRRPHGGIARAKNTCIKLLLESGVDLGYLADDDLFYKDNSWYRAYEDAVERTGIDHFSYFFENKPCETVTIKGHTVRRTPSVNGCFLTFTRKIIDKVGFFKILPHEYGHEHSNFSLRVARLTDQKYFYDVVDATDRIELMIESLSSRSIGVVDPVKMSENEKQAILSEFKYEPFIE